MYNHEPRYTTNGPDQQLAVLKCKNAEMTLSSVEIRDLIVAYEKMVVIDTLSKE
jgi:hypothetical protein